MGKSGWHSDKHGLLPPFDWTACQLRKVALKKLRRFAAQGWGAAFRGHFQASAEGPNNRHTQRRRSHLRDALKCSVPGAPGVSMVAAQWAAWGRGSLSRATGSSTGH